MPRILDQPIVLPKVGDVLGDLWRVTRAEELRGGNWFNVDLTSERPIADIPSGIVFGLEFCDLGWNKCHFEVTTDFGQGPASYVIALDFTADEYLYSQLLDKDWRQIHDSELERKAKVLALALLSKAPEFKDLGCPERWFTKNEARKIWQSR